MSQTTAAPANDTVNRMLHGARALFAGAALACSLVTEAAPRSEPKPDWSARDMPSLAGRTVLVTGGTSGMGYEDALAVARAGADVIIAARNPERGQASIANIRQAVPNANVTFEAVDLANLESVRGLASRLRERLPKLDVLINNAAIMAPPTRSESADGYEMQFATNYLGHFALTGLLLPLLQNSDDARVVSLSSIAAGRGTLNLDDLQAERQYDPYATYAQSKLAVLVWGVDLQRRSEASNWGLRSIVAHPGVAVTELIKRGPGLDSEFGKQWAQDRDVYHSAAQGALPTLYAATAPDAHGGAYYGPTGDDEKRGPLGFATVPETVNDRALAEALWQVSERLTGVTYP